MRFIQLLVLALTFCLADAYLVAPPGTPAPGSSRLCSAWVESSYGMSCEIIRRFYGMTQEEFEEWNPSVGRLGDGCSLIDGLCYCVQVNFVSQGPTWTPPPTSTTSSTSTSTYPGGGIATPAPTQAGMVDNCNEFYLVVADDSCFDISAAHSISLADFYMWNPAVGTSCGGLWPDYYVCVGILSNATTTTTSTTATTRTATTSSTTKTTTTTTSSTASPIGPTPTMPGIADDCDRFYKVSSGDLCDTIAQRHGITVGQLQSWNSNIDSRCSNLWLGYYICVHVAGAPTTSSTTRTTTTSTTASGPSPTQPGMIESCTKYHRAEGGDTCDVIIKEKYPYVNSLPLFFRWNPAVGSTCSNILPGYYYCVATELHQPMPGIVDNCRRYYQVKDGDTCWTIQQQWGITAAQFNRWNPLVGTSCASLWVRYFVCIGV